MSVLDRLSHLPPEKLKGFSERELELLEKMFAEVERTQNPQVDISQAGELWRLIVVAPDWAGLLDAVSGVVHERGHNIQFLVATTDREERLAFIMLFLKLAPKEAEELRSQEMLALLKHAARGEVSVRRMINVGAKKLRVFLAISEELKSLAKPKEYKEIVRPGGELEQFVVTRSQAYLTERDPRTLAELVLLQHRFQEAVRKGKGVQVRVANLMAGGEELTGVTVAGESRALALYDVLEAIRQFVPDFRRRYDKEFDTDDGIAVIRVEFVDGEYRPLPPELCVSLENFLRERLGSRGVRPRDFRLRSGAELVGRILIPRLLEEAEQTGRPQLLILPEGVDEGVAYFRMVLVNEGEDLSERIRRSLDTKTGVVVANLKVNQARQMRVCLFSVHVDLAHFQSEEEIYEALRGAVLEHLPQARDFDEGMRRLSMAKLREIQELLGDRVPARFVKRVFYSFDDAYRITTPSQELADEIAFVYDLFTRRLASGRPVVDFIQERDKIVVGVAGIRLPLEPIAEALKDYKPFFNGAEVMGVNVYLFKFKKPKGRRPKTLIKGIKLEEVQA
ncbi:hypothetical protein DRO33_02990 [Candidatus Bathyarchaeota archaeon]|nr:MAG: hypothetical protein DRO33_02990 [Candidatus Bathyarchaeota archaeon]